MSGLWNWVSDSLLNNKNLGLVYLLDIINQLYSIQFNSTEQISQIFVLFILNLKYCLFSDVLDC